MTESVREESRRVRRPDEGGSGPKRIVLGLDAGCGTRSDIADRVQERVGEKLRVQNLNDPELLAWRERSLGKEARRAPTLFEIEGGKVKAWTGWRMGWALSRSVGPAATWEVMQALGEVGAAPRIGESAVIEELPEEASGAVDSISRVRLLKGLGGV